MTLELKKFSMKTISFKPDESKDLAYEQIALFKELVKKYVN